jgi:hypothetical protein
VRGKKGGWTVVDTVLAIRDWDGIDAEKKEQKRSNGNLFFHQTQLYVK